MPLAEKNIIGAEEVKSKVPLKKSTIAWSAGAMVVLALIGVFAPRLRSSGSAEPSHDPSPSYKAKSDKQQLNAGRPEVIDQEVKEANDRAAREAQAVELRRRYEEQQRQFQAQNQQPGLPKDTGLPSTRPVVPPNARRDSDAAVIYNRPGPNAVGAGQQAQGAVDADFESAARTSVSVKFDNGGDAKGGAGKEPVSALDARLRSMLPQQADPVAAGAAYPVSPQSNPAIEALLESQRRAANQPTSQAQADKAWLREYAEETRQNKPLKSYRTTSPYTLLQGKVIPAVLMRDLNSDLPGEVTACTTVDMYDSVRSSYLLMPKGSCLSGRYQNSVRVGQSRLMFAFSRITMPNGVSFDLPGNPGSDLAGAAGVSGEVDNHFWEMFRNSFLVAWGAERLEASKQTPTTTYGSTSGAQTAAGQVLVDVSRTILERQKVIPPTITIEKGTRINVEVTRDMEFPGPYRK